MKQARFPRTAVEHGRYHQEVRIPRSDLGGCCAKEMDARAHQNRVKRLIIRPGRPIGNGYLGYRSGTLHDVRLNQHQFANLQQTEEKLEALTPAAARAGLWLGNDVLATAT